MTLSGYCFAFYFVVTLYVVYYDDANIHKIQNIQYINAQKIQCLIFINTPMEQTEITKRFLQAIKYIRENIYDGEKLETNASIAKKLNISPSFITEVEKGRSNAKIQKIQAICSVFNISRDWLEFGYGTMLSKIDNLHILNIPPDENGVIKFTKEEFQKHLSELMTAYTDKYFDNKGFSLFRLNILNEKDKEINRLYKLIKEKDKQIENLIYENALLKAQIPSSSKE